MSTKTFEFTMDFLTYGNLAILIFGFFFSLRFYVKGLLYFGILISTEILSLIYIKDNLFLFSISYYIHFFCIAFYVMVEMFRIPKHYFMIAAMLMATPMLIGLATLQSMEGYHSYDRQIYNLSVILLAMIPLMRYIQGKLKIKAHEQTVLVVILCYFTLDLILALSMNYLINQPLKMVVWIWLFRALCLAAFYFSLAQFIWKKQIQ
ncbi:MAG: hypothetical protein AB8B72_11015 [Crocinitomicaceae bacterium]